MDGTARIKNIRQARQKSPGILQETRFLIRDRLALIKPDAVVRVDLTGCNRERTLEGLTAPVLRALAPESMNISLGREWAA